MLKKTRVELDIISDPPMNLIIESCMRGGVCMRRKRYVKANNNALGPLYDSTKPSTFISYLDGHNLSAWAMSQIQPIRASDNVIAQDDDDVLDSPDQCTCTCIPKRSRIPEADLIDHIHYGIKRTNLYFA